jgi:hyperosmotically inducible protein
MSLNALLKNPKHKELPMKMTIEIKKSISAHRVLMITCLSAVLALVGCQQEDTAEKAGQKIDHAAENAEQKIEQTTEKANQKIEAAKESLEQKADSAKEYINDSIDASKGELDKARQKIDRAAENAKQEIGQATEKAGKELESEKDKAVINEEYFDDSEIITMKVKEAILNDPMLKASQIEVATVNGVVKLSGTVDSEQSLGRAMEVASSQKNVKSVQTELIVKTNPPRK